MRKHFLTGIALLPLLASLCSATPCSASDQTWTVDPSVQPFGYGSEESGTSAYLGVDIGDVTSERVSALKLKDEKGVEITTVDQDAPAGKAGLKVHDVILSMNGTAVDSGAQIKRMIHETPAGRVITLEVSRDGSVQTFKVKLADRRKQFAWTQPNPNEFRVEVPPIPNMPDFEMPSMNVVVVQSSARSGLAVENLTPQLGEFFGVKNGNGVLVRSVEKGSRAEKAGLRAGDVITKVNDQPVHDTSDFSHALRSRKGSDSVGVSVVRDKKEQNLNITLPERKESGSLYDEDGDESYDRILNADDDEVDVSAVRNEVARLRPQIELMAADAAAQAGATFCPEQQRRLRAQKEHLKEIKAGAQGKLRKNQEKMRDQMERIKREMRGEWIEI